MSHPSDWNQNAEDKNEHEYKHAEEEEDFLEEHDDDDDDDADDDGDDDGDDLSEMPELRSCLGALVAAIAFWLGLALTALCFCTVFAVALRCI